MRTRILFVFGLLISFSSIANGQDKSLAQALTDVDAVGNGGFGHEKAIAGWKVLGKAGADQVPMILAAIKTDKPLAANWLRSAADQILERQRDGGKSLPAKQLEEVVFDQNYAPRARRLAFEWLKQADKTAETRIIPKMLNDSSLEMRREAVALAMSKAEALGEGPDAVKQLRVAVTSARDFDQVEAISALLEKQGQKIDLQKHFGFLTKWKLIGPFDNTDKGGFDVAYGPEADLASKTSYPGKTNEISWKEHTSTDTYGAVELNDAIGKHMGAIAYAFTEFNSDKEQEVDLRLVSKNATKIWVNGEEVMANEVYHSGSKFDQYATRAKLKAGKNSILMKVCQNEQTESWAQSWQFQLRVCDELGTAILPTP